MGNSLRKDYMLSDYAIGTSGPEFIFKIFSGVNRQTKNDVSIFLTTTKEIEQKFGKQNLNKIIQRIKNNLLILSNLNHPNILKVFSPTLIESGNEIAFITEPVLGSISNVFFQNFGSNFNLNENFNKSQNKQQQSQIGKVPYPQKPVKIKIEKFELTHGLLQILDGINYLHNEAKLLHLDICSSNIFISHSKNFPWKLGGFFFSLPVASPNSNLILKKIDSSQKIPEVSINVENNENKISLSSFFFNLGLELNFFNDSISFSSNINYSSPEYVLENKVYFESDIFSFGCLYYNLMFRLFEINNDINENKIENEYFILNISSDYEREVNLKKRNLISIYKEKIEKIINKKIFIPKNLKENEGIELIKILNYDFNFRYNSNLILEDESICLFNDEIRGIRLLGLIKKQDSKKKSNFFEVILPKLIEKYSSKTIFNYVIPFLNNILYEKENFNSILSNYLNCIFKIEISDFEKLVYKNISKILQNNFGNEKILLLILSKLEIVLQKTTSEQRNNIILPFLMKCVESIFVDVQIESIKKSQEIFSNKIISYYEFKNFLLPKIKLSSRIHSNNFVKINSIVCLGKVSTSLDEQSLIEDIVPILDYNLNNEKNISILMSVVGVYYKISKQFDSNFILTKILPKIITIGSHNLIDIDQFVKFMKSVKGMLFYVENEKIEQLKKKKEIEMEREKQKEKQKQIEFENVVKNDQVGNTINEKDDLNSNQQNNQQIKLRNDQNLSNKIEEKILEKKMNNLNEISEDSKMQQNLSSNLFLKKKLDLSEKSNQIFFDNDDSLDNKNNQTNSLSNNSSQNVQNKFDNSIEKKNDDLFKFDFPKENKKDDSIFPKNPQNVIKDENSNIDNLNVQNNNLNNSKSNLMNNFVNTDRNKNSKILENSNQINLNDEIKMKTDKNFEDDISMKSEPKKEIKTEKFENILDRYLKNEISSSPSVSNNFESNFDKFVENVNSNKKNKTNVFSNNQDIIDIKDENFYLEEKDELKKEEKVNNSDIFDEKEFDNKFEKKNTDNVDFDKVLRNINLMEH